MLKRVKINGQNRPIHFGMRALTILNGKFGIQNYFHLFDKAIEDPLNQFEIVAVGLQEGKRLLAKESQTPSDLKIIKEEFEITGDLVADWCDDEPFVFEEMFKIFEEQTISFLEKKSKMKKGELMKQMLKAAKEIQIVNQQSEESKK